MPDGIFAIPINDLFGVFVTVVIVVAIDGVYPQFCVRILILPISKLFLTN